MKPSHVRRCFPDRAADTYTDALAAAIGAMGVDPALRNVLVTHQLEEAMLLGRRIIVMHPDSTICEFDLTDLPYPRDLDDSTLRRLKEAITDQCRYTA